MAVLKVRCSCGKGVRLDSGSAGRTGRCPGCRRSITTPPADVIEAYNGLTIGIDELEKLTAPGPPPDEHSEGAWQLDQVLQERYEVIRKLGEGSFGSVWLFRHLAWDMNLAVKQLRPGLEHHRERFVREANAWIELGMHPNVITAWYVDDLNDGRLYLFLEYADGGDLHQWIKDGKTRDLAAALDIAIQLCRGLEHCHAQGLVHRDFKPLNVMMTAAGAAKVTDFGAVKFAAMGAGGTDDVPSELLDLRRTIGGQRQGSPAYMPPEQWVVGGPVDHWADLYALGVSIHELLTGTHPIRAVGGSLASWTQAHAQSPPRPLRMDREDAPEALERLALHCLAKRPADRPGSAGEVADRLEVIYHKELGQPHPRPRPNAVELRAEELNNRAVTLVSLGRETDAKGRQPEDLLEEALREDPHHPEAVYNRGLLSWRAAQITPEQLINRLDDARQENQSSWRVPYLIGRVCMESGDADQALRAFEEAAELGGQIPEVQSAIKVVRDRRDSWGGRLLRTFDGHPNSVEKAVFSPDGRYLLTVCPDSDYSASTMFLWELEAGRLVRALERDDGLVASVSFTPDARFVLSGDSNGIVQVWEVGTGRPVLTIEGHEGTVNSVAVSPDGCHALTVASKRSAHTREEIKLWELETGRFVRTFEDQEGQVGSVAFAPNGEFALSTGNRKPVNDWDPERVSSIKLWEVSTGLLVRAFDEHKGWTTNSSVFTPDGRFVISGGTQLRLWEVASGRLVRTFEGTRGVSESVAVTPDGRYAMSFDDYHNVRKQLTIKSVRIWDIVSGRLIRTFQGNQDLLDWVSFAPDGRHVLSGRKPRFAYDSEGNLQTLRDREVAAWLWEIGIGEAQGLALCSPQTAEDIGAFDEKVVDLKREARDQITLSPGLAYSAAKKAMAVPTHSKNPELLELRHRAGLKGRIVDLSTWWTLRVLTVHTSGVRSLALSPDGCHALVGGDSCIELWEVGTGRLLRTFEGHEDTVDSLAFSPDGRLALSGGIDRTVRLWEVGTGRLLRTFEDETKIDGSLSVAFSSVGRHALYGGSAGFGRVELWGPDTGRFVHVFDGDDWDKRRSMAFSPDGRHALYGGFRSIEVWETSTGRLERAFDGRNDMVESVAFSPDGRYFLTANGFLVTAAPLPDDPGPAPDDEQDRGDGFIRLWEVETGRLVRTFVGHSGPVKSVAFSSDGRFVLSGGEGGSVVLQQLVWDHEFPEAADWHEGAKPYLERFLTLRTPQSTSHGPSAQRSAIPTWSEEQFQELLGRLGVAGYGWLRPEGVRRELDQMAVNWHDAHGAGTEPELELKEPCHFSSSIGPPPPPIEDGDVPPPRRPQGTSRVDHGGMSVIPRPSCDANRAADLNIAYQQELARWREEYTHWKALPFWKRWREQVPRRPEPPVGI